MSEHRIEREVVATSDGQTVTVRVVVSAPNADDALRLFDSAIAVDANFDWGMGEGNPHE